MKNIFQKNFKVLLLVIISLYSFTYASTTPSSLGSTQKITPYVFTHNLGIGSKGTDITWLQIRLTEEGVYQGPISGYFGRLTSKAVKIYQAKYHISQVGTVGPLTRQRLNVTSVSSNTLLPIAASTSPLQTSPISSSVVSDTTTITSCAEIINPGIYELTSDLTSTSTEICLNIHNTSDVHLDCNGHGIHISANNTNGVALLFNRISNFSINNCSFSGTQHNDVVQIVNSSEGEFKNNTLSGIGGFSISNSPVIEVTHNNFDNSSGITIQAGSAYATLSDNVINNGLGIFSNIVTITGNTITGGTNAKNVSSLTFDNNTLLARRTEDIIFGGTLDLNGVVNSSVTNNYIDGRAEPLVIKGTDDILVASELNNVLIKGNTFTNAWDCGIETTGRIDNVQIIDNTITNIGLCGIGGWYEGIYGNYPSSWKSSVISNNHMNNVGSPLVFAENLQIAPGSPFMYEGQLIYFTDNIFRDNTAGNSLPNSVATPIFDFVTNTTNTNHEFSNNVFTNNDFGIKPLKMLPGNAFVDGGGNSCRVEQTSDSPLFCASPFIQGSVSFTTIRNNYTGWVGTQITVGSQPITVSALGRFVAPPKMNQPHVVKIVSADTGNDIDSVSVLPSNTSATYAYASLASPLTLSPGSSYYILSQEVTGQDQWYDYINTVPHTNDASITSAVYGTDAPYTIIGSTNNSYGPVNFLYTVAKTCEYPAPPPGFHYEGGQSYPACGATLVHN